MICQQLPPRNSVAFSSVTSPVSNISSFELWIQKQHRPSQGIGQALGPQDLSPFDYNSSINLSPGGTFEHSDWNRNAYLFTYWPMPTYWKTRSGGYNKLHYCRLTMSFCETFRRGSLHTKSNGPTFRTLCTPFNGAGVLSSSSATGNRVQ